MSVLTAAILALALLPLPTAAAGQYATPGPEVLAPDDLSRVMPADIDGAPLCVWAFGPDEMQQGSFFQSESARRPRPGSMTG